MLKKKIAWMLILLMLVTSPMTFAAESDFGNQTYGHVEYLSRVIGAREAGTNKEIEARLYIVSVLESLGYKPEIQFFSYTRKKDDITTEYHSANIIAVKQGKSNQEIILGAHYDTKTHADEKSESLGADDNASGVGLLLEMAERFKEKTPDYTLKFVFYGAEEVGLKGSEHHASTMTEAEIKNTVAMINVDTILAGDKRYVYSDGGGKGWLREQALSIAKKLGIELHTNPGLNPEYPKGTTGDWSDHAPYKERGIPFLYLEATNWEIGELDGYDQSEKFGAFFHTSMDNLDFFEKEFPGRGLENVNAFSKVLFELIQTIQVPSEEKVIYTVVRGDTLFKIAQAHGVTIEAILELNSIKNRNLIFPGNVINIPQSYLTPSSKQLMHTVVNGDTLFKIASSHGVTVDDLVKLNMIKNKNLIFAGQVLAIPK